MKKLATLVTLVVAAMVGSWLVAQAHPGIGGCKPSTQGDIVWSADCTAKVPVLLVWGRSATGAAPVAGQCVFPWSGHFAWAACTGLYDFKLPAGTVFTKFCVGVGNTTAVDLDADDVITYKLMNTGETTTYATLTAQDSGGDIGDGPSFGCVTPSTPQYSGTELIHITTDTVAGAPTGQGYVVVLVYGY